MIEPSRFTEIVEDNKEYQMCHPPQIAKIVEEKPKSVQ